MDETHVADAIRRSFAPFRFERPVDRLSTRRTGLRLGRGAVSFAAIAVGAVVLWVASAAPFTAGPRITFAGWAPNPIAPDVALTAASESVCGMQQGTSATSLRAQDQRGTAAALLFEDGGQLSVCLVTRDNAGAVVAAAAGASHLASNPGTLAVDTTLSAPASAQNPGVMVVAGRISPAAASVDVHREDDIVVHATVTSGFFLAWWPSEAKVVQVVALDHAGNVVAEVRP